MGFSSVRFLKPLDANLMCGICSGVLDTPVLTPCGHTFCETCINKWMETPGVKSCPECRSKMDRESTRSILSLRNLIEAMEVTCSNKSRGCNEIFKLENQDSHLQTCSYESVTCVGCHEEMDRLQLPIHQIDCSALIALLQEDDDEEDEAINSSHDITDESADHANACEVTATPTSQTRYSRVDQSQPGASTEQLLRLLYRVSSLEKQVTRLLDDLQEAHFKNSLLYLQNKKLKEEEELRQQKLAERVTQSQTLLTFNLNVTNQHDIAKLSLFIAKHLLHKPSHIDSDEVFAAIRKSYEMHFYHISTNSRVEHDVHMLLATSFASGWFTSTQRITLGCWLQCVHKCQGCRQVLQG